LVAGHLLARKSPSRTYKDVVVNHPAPLPEPVDIFTDGRGGTLDFVAALATSGQVSTWQQLMDEDLLSGHPLWEWQLMISGAEGALGRYRTALSEGTGWDARVAVGEALWWIAGLVEYLGRSTPSSKGRRGRHYNEIGQTSAGQLLLGLSFLRNRADHQLAPALMERESVVATGPDGEVPVVLHPDGRREPLNVTVSVTRSLRPWEAAPPGGFRFCDLDALPNPDPQFAEAFGRGQMYANWVGGRDVADVLCAALATLRLTVTVTVTVAGGDRQEPSAVLPGVDLSEGQKELTVHIDDFDTSW
jgi:hypothetical protein